MSLPKKFYEVMFVLVVFIGCFIGINGNPAPFSFTFPTISSLQQQKTEAPIVLKSYSGRRIDNNSIRMVYFNDDTVAVVELGQSKLLLSCELIEITEPNQLFKVLGELKTKARPVGVTFTEMVTLMGQCKQLEERRLRKHRELLKINNTNSLNQGRGLSNPLTLLSGIIPGTKWCGTGDIAQNYYDLGEDQTVDSCCRAHDLCPVKIRAYSRKYNLTNNSLYTKSHCKCDDDLYNCLKKANFSNTANLMGNIYFNLVQVPCVEETLKGRYFRKARNNF